MTTTLNVNPISRSIEQACVKYNNAPNMLLPILHQLQETIGYIPSLAYSQIAKTLNLSKAEVYGVVSFYHDFRQQPPATATIKVCMAEACQSMGARELMVELKSTFAPLLDTKTKPIPLALDDVFCLGNCALAPAVMIDDKVYGRANLSLVKGVLRGCDV